MAPEAYGWGGPAALYHYGPDRLLSIIGFKGTEPFTWQQSVRAGVSPRMTNEGRERMSLPPRVPDFEIETDADADRAAWGVLFRGLPGRWGADSSPWRDIPDDVAQDYLSTTAWVYQQGIADVGPQG